MNLTNRPVYQKDQKRSKQELSGARPPNAEEKRHWARVCQLGCLICRRPATIHHTGTGAGGRKDHMKVLPLCYHHHQGDEGIDAKHNGSPQSKRAWQGIYGLEEDLLAQVELELIEQEKLKI